MGPGLQFVRADVAEDRAAGVDRGDGLIGVVHDAMWVGAVGESEIVADLVQDDGSEAVFVFVLAPVFEAMVAHDADDAGLIAQSEDPPDGVFAGGCFNLSRFVFIGGVNVETGETDLYIDRIGFAFFKPDQDGVGAVAFAFGRVQIGDRHRSSGPDRHRAMKEAGDFVTDEMGLQAIELSDGLQCDAAEMVWRAGRGFALAEDCGQEQEDERSVCHGSVQVFEITPKKNGHSTEVE